MQDSETIPVVEEEVQIDKHTVRKGRVRVATVTEIHDELASAELESSDVAISRVPIGRQVEIPPTVRTVGDTVIVPVLEEVLVVERRLILKEELHIKRCVSKESVEIPVRLRKQRAVIEREKDASHQPNEENENGG
jgi:stress response protein YsnF